MQQVLLEKSKKHQSDLERLGKQVGDEPLSPNVLLLKPTKQIVGMATILQNPKTNDVDFIFYLDRLSTVLIEK